MQPLALKRAGRRSGGSGGSGGSSSGGGGGFGKRRGKDDGAEASKDPEKRLANLNRKLSSILEVRHDGWGVEGLVGGGGGRERERDAHRVGALTGGWLFRVLCAT